MRMGLRPCHKKGSGAASLTPEVSWAGPGDFSLIVLNICVCVCVHVRALLSVVPWAPLYLVLYKFIEMPLLPGKASCDIPTDKS